MPRAVNALKLDRKLHMPAGYLQAAQQAMDSFSYALVFDASRECACSLTVTACVCTGKPLSSCLLDSAVHVYKDTLVAGCCSTDDCGSLKSCHADEGICQQFPPCTNAWLKHVRHDQALSWECALHELTIGPYNAVGASHRLHALSVRAAAGQPETRLGADRAGRDADKAGAAA